MLSLLWRGGRLWPSEEGEFFLERFWAWSIGDRESSEWQPRTWGWGRDFQVWPMFIIIFILLPDIHEFLVWCLNVLVGFFSLFFLYLGLLAFASCLILKWFHVPCFLRSLMRCWHSHLYFFILFLKLIWKIVLTHYYVWDHWLICEIRFVRVHWFPLLCSVCCFLSFWCLAVDCFRFPIPTWKVWIRA